jgi:hypothetical protein
VVGRVGVWVRKRDVEVLKLRVVELEGEVARAKRLGREAYDRANRRALADAKRFESLTDKFLELAKRPPLVVQPPDTASIVKEAVEGVAHVLNGWIQVNPPQQAQVVLGMDGQGLDQRAGVPNDIDVFPEWESMAPPSMATFFRPQGEYTPYVPGSGNTVPPKGGVE